MQTGAEGQINALEVPEVSKGIWKHLQIEATRQINTLEIR
jgi:hypothetical protein